MPPTQGSSVTRNPWAGGHNPVGIGLQTHVCVWGVRSIYRTRIWDRDGMEPSGWLLCQAKECIGPPGQHDEPSSHRGAQFLALDPTHGIAHDCGAVLDLK